MALLENKPRPPVLQGDPGVSRDGPAAEIHVQAVDEGGGVPVLIHHRQVDRVPMLRHAGGDRRVEGAAGLNALPLIRGEILGQQQFDRNVAKIHV